MVEVENKVLVLKDMDSDEFTDIVLFDNAVDMEKIKRNMNELWERDDSWTFDDMLKMLDEFGRYSIFPLNRLETIEY